MSAVPAVVEVPALGEWDFGDFPYALEPLVVPETGTLDVPYRGNPCAVPFDIVPRWLSDHADDDSSTIPGEPAESTDRLFWFRWITGHQATFVVWQLIAANLSALEDEGSDDRPFAATVDLVHGYCAMLLYTAATPHRVYHELIRPSMFLQHRGFSGSWAPDFGPVRDLFRGKAPCLATPEGAALRAAVRTYMTIHAGIAARLVPSGRSLLQESAETTPVTDPDVQGVLYDNYFMTLRAPTPAADVVAQLHRRLSAIARDIGAHGLAPGDPTEGLDEAGDVDEVPEELTRPEVRALADDFVGVLARTAAAGASAVPDAPGGQEPA